MVMWNRYSYGKQYKPTPKPQHKRKAEQMQPKTCRICGKTATNNGLCKTCAEFVESMRETSEKWKERANNEH